MANDSMTTTRPSPGELSEHTASIPFGGLGGFGHVQFATRDLDRLTNYYTDVIGLSSLSSGSGERYLSTGIAGQAVTLRQANQDGLDHIAFKLAAKISVPDAEQILHRSGLKAERRHDAELGIPELLEFDDPEGNRIQLYHEASEEAPGYSGRGVEPHKLGHICLRAREVQRLCDWYEQTLGFRWSDWIGDFFVFIRLGPDHHSLNLLAGKETGNVVHHLAFELRDFGHVQQACDHLSRNGFTLVWGPGRHGPGHNVFTYHLDPDGTVVELFTQLDVVNEALGVFDPRPWHKDNPQRPKRWIPDPLAPNYWGIHPPDSFL